MTIARREPTGVVAVLPLKQSAEGGAGSFLVRSDDGGRYWCKVRNNGQSTRIPATEQIVGRLGTLVGIAVCGVSLVWIPEELAGWEYRPNQQLEAGWAHGSRDIEPVTLAWQLDHRASDDNPRRHAGFFALYDWLFGGDPQWLIRVPSDWMYYSHDHGFYLPGGPDWSLDTLRAAAEEEHLLGQDMAGLDPREVRRIADRVESLTGKEILESIDDLPQEWISDEELDEVVAFALRRCKTTAERFRRAAGSLGTT